MVSPDSLAVAVQLPAQLRGSGLYSDHVVGSITAGLQRLRSLPHPVESDGDAALGAHSQHNGRVDGYSWYRGLIQWISKHLLRAVLPRPRYVRRGVHVVQAQLRLGHDGRGGVRGVEPGDGSRASTSRSRRRRYCSPGSSSCTRSSQRSIWSPGLSGSGG